MSEPDELATSAMVASPAPAAPTRPLMTRGLALLFAVAGGAAVGNLYWAQPLLDFIAEDLHASTASAGWLVAATQLGYAAGILLLVPLGDVRDRRKLVPFILGCSAVALVLCALASSFGFLLAALALLGVTTVSGQFLAPLAGDLADDDHRGSVVGTVVAGLLIGILISRTVSGLIAGAAGWQAVYVVAAVAALVFAALLDRAIPSLQPKARVPYPALIASVWTVVRTERTERTVRWTLVLGATAFAVFTMFWTALTFLLSAAPFDYSVTQIGLFGLLGVAGALAAQRAGRLHDRGLSLPATGIGWALILASFALAAFAGRSVALVVVVVLVLDIAVQGVNLLNQSRIFAVSGEARSRLNTAFVTSNFIGGAIGSAAASVLWTAGGWPAVSIAGIVLSAIAFAVWALGRRGPLIVAR